MLIKKYKSGKSAIHDIGLFATQNIKKGEYILTFKGSPRKLADCKGEANSDECWDWLGIGVGRWLKVYKPESYVNHSCEPNAGIKGSVRLYALKNINIGDEITIDYSTTETDDHWFMKCNCGKIGCRKKIGPIFTLNNKIFSSYLPYIPTFAKRKYYARKTRKISK